MMKRPFNLEEANTFLHALDREGVFTFQTFHDRIKGAGARVLHGTFAQHQQDLMRLNEEGHGVYVMVNKGDGIAHGNAKTCRTAANVVAVRALFVDLDGAPPEPVLAYQPDIVIESSQDRWHAYWLTRDFPLDKFTSCQQQLAKKFNADPKVFDLPRVMRVPGFWHLKGEPFQTRIHSINGKENPHVR